MNKILFYEDSAVITWQGGVMATQYLERSSGLADWDVLRTNIPPTPVYDQLQLNDDGKPAQFFRIRVNER